MIFSSGTVEGGHPYLEGLVQPSDQGEELDPVAGQGSGKAPGRRYPIENRFGAAQCPNGQLSLGKSQQQSGAIVEVSGLDHQLGRRQLLVWSGAIQQYLGRASTQHRAFGRQQTGPNRFSGKRMTPGEYGPVDDQEFGAHGSAEGVHRLSAVQSAIAGTRSQSGWTPADRTRRPGSSRESKRDSTTAAKLAGTDQDAPPRSAVLEGTEVSSSSTSSGKPSDLRRISSRSASSSDRPLSSIILSTSLGSSRPSSITDEAAPMRRCKPSTTGVRALSPRSAAEQPPRRRSYSREAPRFRRRPSAGLPKAARSHLGLAPSAAAAALHPAPGWRRRLSPEPMATPSRGAVAPARPGKDGAREHRAACRLAAAASTPRPLGGTCQLLQRPYRSAR